MKRIFKLLLIIAVNIGLVTFVIFSIGKLNNQDNKITEKSFNITANLEKYEEHIGNYNNKRGSLFGKRLDYAIVTQNAPIPFRKDAKWGYIDEKGNVIVDFTYVEAKEFKNGLAAVRIDDKFGFIDESGKVVIDFIYEDVGDFLDNGMATVIKNGKCGVIDKKGNIIIDFIYEHIKNIGSEKFLVIKLNEGFTFLNIETKQILGLFFDDIKSFTDGMAAVKKDGKWGYIDKEGNLIISYQYDEAEKFYNGYTIVKENNKIGIIDSLGNWKQTIKADGLGEVQKNFTPIKTNDKYVFIDFNGNHITEFMYEEIGIISEDIAAIKVNEKWGFIDSNGKIIIDCVFDDVGYFYNDIANVKLNGKWGFVDKNGDVVIDFKYDFNYLVNFNDAGIAICFDECLNFGAINRDGELIIGNFEDTIIDISMAYTIEGSDGIYISNGDKNGYIDLDGNVMIPCEYDEVEFIGNDIAIVKKDDQYACFDKKGNSIIDFGRYEEIRLFSEEYISLEENGKVGLANLRGELIVPIEYDNIGFFGNDVAIVEKDGKKGTIDKNGKSIIPIEYLDIGSFEQNVTWIQKNNGMFAYIDKYGRFLTDFDFLEAYDFSYGVSIAYLENGYVYINENGEIAIPYKYDDAYDFEDGYAEVIYNGKEIYINKNGEEVDKPILEDKYDMIYLKDANTGACVVELNDKYGVINAKGEEIVKCIYKDSDTEFNEHGLIIVENEDGKFGVINSKGEIIVDFKYDDIEEFNEGMAPVKKDIYWGYIDVKGNEIINCQYIIAQEFSEGVAYVCKEHTNETKLAYYVDKNNKKILDVSEYYLGMPFVNGRAVVVKMAPAYEFGIIDIKGNVIGGNFGN